MLRYFKVWLALGWILVFIVVYLSLTPSPATIDIKYIDKVKHFFAYFVLMMWFAQLYKTNNARILYLLFFILMGITLEVLQGLGGVRFFEYSDMLANSLGAVSALFLTKGQLKNIFVLLEQKIMF